MEPQVVHTDHLIDDDLGPYELFQINKYGNVLITHKGYGFVMNEDECIEREREKMEQELSERAERMLDDHIGY